MPSDRQSQQSQQSQQSLQDVMTSFQNLVVPAPALGQRMGGQGGQQPCLVMCDLSTPRWGHDGGALELSSGTQGTKSKLNTFQNPSRCAFGHQLRPWCARRGKRLSLDPADIIEETLPLHSFELRADILSATTYLTERPPRTWTPLR